VAVVALLAAGCGASAGDDKEPEHRSFALNGRTLTVDSDDSALDLVVAEPLALHTPLDRDLPPAHCHAFGNHAVDSHCGQNRRDRRGRRLARIRSSARRA